MELGLVHWTYIVLTLLILYVMIRGKEIVVPCIISIFLIGFLIDFSVVDGMRGLFNSIVYSGQKFMEIIVTISIVSALSRLLTDLKSDYLIMKPTEKLMKNQFTSFIVLMLIMYIFSLFLWPSPSVALMGAVMLPIVYNKGMKPLVAAIAINIAGHGMALSHDFIIKGAPTVTATAANISPESIINDGRVLFIVMNVTVLITLIYTLRDELFQKNTVNIVYEDTKNFSLVSKIIAVTVPIVFIADLILINFLGLKGGDATALIISTTLFILIFGSFMKNDEKNKITIDFKDGFEKVTDYIRDGFMFGIKIFAPVIIIGAFFFLGSSDIHAMLGETTITTDGILSDIVIAMSNTIPMNNIVAILGMFIMGAITGLDGSGFSGLPILGSLAYTFGSALDINIAVLAAVGQIATVWVGGGVLIPWAVVAVTGVCDVSPIELCKKNFIPVSCGFIAMLITAIIII